MATQVSLKAASTGALTYYSTYAAARSSAAAGDVINIRADLNEQIILKDGVDIIITSGRILNMTSAYPTITDNGVKCICNIFGEGIILNSYTGSTKQECIKITDDESEIYIECDYLSAPGGETSGAGNFPTVNVANAKKFTLYCNNIYNSRNTAVKITDCSSFFIKSKKITSGTFDTGSKNLGKSVIEFKGSGSVFADEVICDGYGSCIEQTGGIAFFKILKITTLTNATAANPTVLVDNVTGEQFLDLNFDEIQNLNTTDGDAVTLAEGKAKLTGRRIYSEKGLSLDLGANANIICSEIISVMQGVNITNSASEKIILDADLIEGAGGNGGVIYAVNDANFTIRNAKIKNTSSTGSSYGIYLNPGNGNPFITLDNVIVVTGNLTSGETIYCLTGSNETYIYNYGMFVNKVFGGVQLLVGDSSNYKVIDDILIT